jgi:hypothetical protein
MGFEPEHAQWPPCDLPGCAVSTYQSLSFARCFSVSSTTKEDGVRSVGRSIGLDVHRDFCEVAIAQDGGVRSSGRVDTTPEQLELFGSVQSAPSSAAGRLYLETRLFGRHRAHGPTNQPALRR